VANIHSNVGALSTKVSGKASVNYYSVVPAVEQATQILTYLSSSPGFKTYLKDICSTTGIHNSKGYAILNTLQKAGYVNRDEHTKLYSLGYKLISLGQSSLEGIHYRETAKPFLVSLAKETHCSALFAMIASDQFVIIGREDPSIDVGVTLRPGSTANLTYSAAGKAVAAFLPRDELKQLLLRDDLFFHGHPSCLNREKLKRELDDCRRDGYAKAPGKRNSAVVVLASAVLGHKGYPIGIILLIGIFPRTAVRLYGERLVETSRTLSALFGSDVIWPSKRAINHSREIHRKSSNKRV
jgi:IclR family transcriptional regulator, acetate operon repressor